MPIWFCTDGEARTFNMVHGKSWLIAHGTDGCDYLLIAAGLSPRWVIKKLKRFGLRFIVTDATMDTRELLNNEGERVVGCGWQIKIKPPFPARLCIPDIKIMRH